MAAHRLPGADRVVAFLERWPRIVELGRRLRDGLRVAGRPRTLAAAIVLSVARLGRLDHDVPRRRPGGRDPADARPGCARRDGRRARDASCRPDRAIVGTFELTAAAIVTPFGVDHDTAFAMAVLVHATILVVTSVGGAIAVDPDADRHHDAEPATRSRRPTPTMPIAPARAGEPTDVAGDGPDRRARLDDQAVRQAERDDRRERAEADHDRGREPDRQRARPGLAQLADADRQPDGRPGR